MENDIEITTKEDCITLSEREACALIEFIESCLLDMIRKDETIDSLAWVEALISVWRKCGGAYDDDGSENVLQLKMQKSRNIYENAVKG